MKLKQKIGAAKITPYVFIFPFIASFLIFLSVSHH